MQIISKSFLVFLLFCFVRAELVNQGPAIYSRASDGQHTSLFSLRSAEVTVSDTSPNNDVYAVRMVVTNDSGDTQIWFTSTPSGGGYIYQASQGSLYALQPVYYSAVNNTSDYEQTSISTFYTITVFVRLLSTFNYEFCGTQTFSAQTLVNHMSNTDGSNESYPGDFTSSQTLKAFLSVSWNGTTGSLDPDTNEPEPDLPWWETDPTFVGLSFPVPGLGTHTIELPTGVTGVNQSFTFDSDSPISNIFISKDQINSGWTGELIINGVSQGNLEPEPPVPNQSGLNGPESYPSQYQPTITTDGGEGFYWAPTQISTDEGTLEVSYSSSTGSGSSSSSSGSGSSSGGSNQGSGAPSGLMTGNYTDNEGITTTFATDLSNGTYSNAQVSQPSVNQVTTSDSTTTDITVAEADALISDLQTESPEISLPENVGETTKTSLQNMEIKLRSFSPFASASFGTIDSYPVNISMGGYDFNEPIPLDHPIIAIIRAVELVLFTGFLAVSLMKKLTI